LEEAFNVPNLPEHLVPEEFAGNEWFVEEQYERYQKGKNLVDPSWWPIFETIDKALGGAGTASAAPAAAPAAPAKRKILRAIGAVFRRRRRLWLGLPRMT